MTAPDQRPELSLPWQRPDRVLERLAAIGLLLLLAAAAVGAFGLPSRVPIHFSVTGRPDAWGSRGVLLALPVVVIVLYVVIGLVLIVGFGYLVGKTMAERDNARAAETATTPAG